MKHLPTEPVRRPPHGMPTALVDFAFVLVLLFLILVAAQPVTDDVEPQKASERIRPVADLPVHDALSEAAESASENVVELTITDELSYWWDGELVSMESIPVRLRSGEVTELRLRASRSVPFGVIGELLREADQAGIPRTAFLFAPSESAP